MEENGTDTRDMLWGFVRSELWKAFCYGTGAERKYLEMAAESECVRRDMKEWMEEHWKKIELLESVLEQYDE